VHENNTSQYFGAWLTPHLVNFSFLNGNSIDPSPSCKEEHNCFTSILQNQHPVIIDTGASLAITPFHNDFIEPISLPSGNLTLGGMANGLKIKGIGLINWWFNNAQGIDVPFWSLAYYVPDA
jgi:hypothetical protein